jgi:hypothetical protein
MICLLQANDGLHHDAIALVQGRAELLLRFRSATDFSGACCRIVSLGIHLIWQRSEIRDYNNIRAAPSSCV